MGDFLDKYKDRGLLSYLDINDDLEAVLPGPSEKERNESRLRSIITGERRPASHAAKEAGAWTVTNVILPILAGAAKGVSTARKLTHGKKLIWGLGKSGQGVDTLVKTAEKTAKKTAKETAKEAAKHSVEGKGIKRLFSFAKRGLDDTPVEMTAKIANTDKIDVKKAADFIKKHPEAFASNKPIKKEALKSGAKAGAITGAGVMSSNAVSNNGSDTGTFDKMDDAIDFDNRIEMSKGRKVWQFIKGLFDLDDLDPNLYPMDKVHYVLDDLIANTHAWRKSQIDNLGDAEKIKLIKDIAKGDYDTDEMPLSYELYKSYMNLTDTKEENV